MRILFEEDSAGGNGAPSGPSTEPTAATPPSATPPAPTPPAPAPADPPVPAADTVMAGKVTEETELLRVKLAAAEKRNGELETTVKDRELTISKQQDDHNRYRQSVESTKPVRIGMFRRG